MTLKSLEQMIHQKIPLTRQMQVKVAQCTQRKIVLRLPLEPNRNHLGTGFGGSVMAAQALCCWAFLVNYYKTRRWNVTIVLQDSASRFLKPVKNDFLVECRAPRLSEMRNLDLSLKRHGRGRITLRATAASEAVEFIGRYVVVKSAR